MNKKSRIITLCFVGLGGIFLTINDWLNLKNQFLVIIGISFIIGGLLVSMFVENKPKQPTPNEVKHD